MPVRPWKCLYTKDQTLMILRAWEHPNETLPNKDTLELKVKGPIYTQATITKSIHKSDYGKRLYEVVLT